MLSYLYLVFKELHPNLLGEDTKREDASIGHIPSLENISPEERKKIIFSRLLRSGLESNNRNIRNYLETIEYGNNMFEEIKSGKLDFETLKKEDKNILEKYSQIVNVLYNETSKCRRIGEKRENTGDVLKDLTELEKLFNESRINLSLPDRIVRTFGYKAGLRSLEDAKSIFENSRNNAEERNTKLAQKGKIDLEVGDFIKGIEHTEYLPLMFQRGILAKDFLGANATSDGTPLDTDVEKITKVGDSFSATLKGLSVANNFTSSDTTKKKFGRVMLVFSKDDFIETRDENREVKEDNIELLKQNKDKKEVFNNYNKAYGISIGIGSENIKCIVSDEYIDRLGLEIALNGFYIPIVNNDGEVIYTREMYDSFQEKMQGLSHYGKSHFELDETAKKSEMVGIVNLIDRSMQNAKEKQNRILETLRKAIEENGYSLSEERKTDLTPGFVEVIDTGSTDRGTNMPGDGDFDFMVRLDKTLSDNPKKFKDDLRKVLRRNRSTERTNGDR